MQSLGAALDEAPATDAVNLQHELESIRGNARDPKHALLVALEEAIVEQRGGGPASVTEVFAAGMSAVEASSKRGELARLPELLGLLCACVGPCDGAVLRGKFDLVAGVLGAVLRQASPGGAGNGVIASANKKKQGKVDDEGSTAACRAAARCLGLVLARQDDGEAAWLAPSRRQSLDGLLRLATSDPRPKARRAAREAVKFAADAKKPALQVAAKWCAGLCAEVAAGRGGLAPPPPSAFHVLNLVEDLGWGSGAPCALVCDAVAKAALAPRGRDADEQAFFDARAFRALAAALRGAPAAAKKAATRALLGDGRPSSTFASPSDDVARAWADALAASAAPYDGDAALAGAAAAQLLQCRARDGGASAATAAKALEAHLAADPGDAGATAAFLDALAKTAATLRGAADPLLAVYAAALERGARADARFPAAGAAPNLAAVAGAVAARRAATVDVATQRGLDGVLAVALRSLGTEAFLDVLPRGATCFPGVARLAFKDGANHSLLTLADLGDCVLVPAASAGDAMAAELWALAPLYCARGAGDFEAAAAARDAILAALNGADAARKRVACECLAALGPRRDQPSAGAGARKCLPALFGAALDDDADAAAAAAAAVAAVAPSAEPSFVSAIFKKLATRLLGSVSALAAAGSRGRKRGAGGDDKSDALKAAKLCDLASALAPSLELASADVLWRAALPLAALDAHLDLQKRAYKIFAALCSRPDFLASKADAVVEALGQQGACPVACRAARVTCLAKVVEASPAPKPIVAALVGEVVLCLKDANGKARAAAFGLLDAMAAAMDEKAGALVEFIHMLLGGLGARTSHMRSAALVAVARALYAYGDRADVLDLVPKLLDAAAVLLRDKAREVAKATLAFIHVAVSLLCSATKHLARADALAPLLPKLVEALLLWAHERKCRFRAKVKAILRKLCREYGHDAVAGFVPESDKAIVAHLKKMESRAKKAKGAKKEQPKNAADAMAVDDDVDEDSVDDRFDEPDLGAVDDSDDEMGDDATRDRARDLSKPFSRGAAPRRAASTLAEAPGHVLDLLNAVDDSRDFADADDSDDDDDGMDVAVGDDGRVTVFKADKLAKAAKKAREQQAARGPARRLKPTSKAGKRARKKAGGDVFKKDSLQPYSYATLGDIARKSKRQRR